MAPFIGSLRGGGASVRTARDSVRTAQMQALSGSSGGLTPASVGLVQWARGDVDLQSVLEGRASGWLDGSGLDQHWTQSQVDDRPIISGDSIDGVPVVSFGTGGSANKFFRTAANFTDRFGVDMDGAHARTVIAVVKPAFDAAWGITGGNLWVQSSWNAQFELRSNAIPAVVDGAYGWMRAAGDYANALQFTPVTGGALGPYNGTPTLIEWRSTGFDNFELLINNALVATTPAVMYGTPGGAGVAQLSINFIAFCGGLAEHLVYDYSLGDSAPAHLQTVSYLADRFPSLTLAG